MKGRLKNNRVDLEYSNTISKRTMRWMIKYKSLNIVKTRTIRKAMMILTNTE